jgi:aspartyl protease family protein
MDDSHNTGTQLGTWMTVLFWVVLIGLAGFYFFWEEQQDFNPNTHPQLLQTDDGDKLVLKPNNDGHFVLTGKINGKPVPMLLDTGATLVSVSEKRAKTLGLRKGLAGIAYTANGKVTVYETQIDELILGNFILRNVQASINPGMNQMTEILLGISALSQLDFAQRQGNLEISLKQPLTFD